MYIKSIITKLKLELLGKRAFTIINSNVVKTLSQSFYKKVERDSLPLKQKNLHKC